ncbi:MAG: hypothetical protein R3279_11525 [Putridiphycobacter sp.]|nr:hypothetical protein [Putridiphycobacter sp.]
MAKKTLEKTGNKVSKNYFHEVYKDAFMVLYRDDQYQFYEIRYTPNAFNLFKIEDAKTVINNSMIAFQKEIDKNHNYQILIINTLDGGPTIERQTQEYVHSVLFPFFIKHGIQTHLYCLGEEVISKLSMSVTAEKYQSEDIQSHFFARYKDCIDWIKTNT